MAKHMASLHHPGADTRMRLVRAGLFAFSEKGFEAVGIREIAQRARANSAMVQYHFGGKDGLYLEVLRWIASDIFAQREQPPPVPADPEARTRAWAVGHIWNYVRMLMRNLRDCHLEAPGNPGGDLHRAAMTLWNREMHHPRPATSALVLDTLRPYLQGLQACIRVLRPDLDEDGILHMGICLNGPLLFLQDHLGLVGLIRGKGLDALDLDALEATFLDYILRGLGLDPAACAQGA